MTSDLRSTDTLNPAQQAALDRFALGTPSKVRAVQRGAGRSQKYAVRTPAGDVFVKFRADAPGLPARLAVAHEIERSCARAGLAVPPPCATPQGETVVIEGAIVCDVHRVVPGRSFEKASRAHTASAALALAQLHVHLRTQVRSGRITPPEPGPAFHNRRGVTEALARLAQQLAPSHLVPAGALAARYERAARAAEVAGLARHPPQPIHGDWHPGNLLFDDQRVVAILDFDQVSFAPPAFDLASGLVHFSWRPRPAARAQPMLEPDRARLTTFLSAYHDSAKRVQEEVSHTPNAYAGTHDDAQLLPALMIEALIAEAVSAASRVLAQAPADAALLLNAAEVAGSWYERLPASTFDTGTRAV